MEPKPLRIVKEGEKKIYWTVMEKENGQWKKLKTYTMKRDAQNYIRETGRNQDLRLGKHDSE